MNGIVGCMPRLGDLEQAVMDRLWADPPAPRSVREVHTDLADTRAIAYTTVLTVLDRLAKKGLVTRELVGRSWLYRPVRTRAQTAVDEMLATIHAGGPRERRELLEELFARLSADTDLPPCAPLWPPALRLKVTPTGDTNGD